MRTLAVAIALAVAACGTVRDTRDGFADIGRFADDAVSDSIDGSHADASLDALDVRDAPMAVSREFMACGRTIMIRGTACDNDSTHIDCFGGGECQGGVAWRNLYAPIPVPNVCGIDTDLTHACCIEQVTCALGCASDWRDRIGPGPDPFDPRLLCAETEWCPDGGDAACDASTDADATE